MEKKNTEVIQIINNSGGRVVPSDSEEHIETTSFMQMFCFQVTVGFDTPRQTRGYSTNGV